MPRSTRFADHLTSGVLASRPAASAVPDGSLYSATDTDVVYQSDGASTWSVYVNAAAGGGGGSEPGVFCGAEIYCSPNMAFEGPGQWTMPFDQVQLDTDSIADIENNQLVIPAGLGGVWHYGFAFQFLTDGGTIVMQAHLDVDGDAWNLIAVQPVQGFPQVSLAASAIDTFSDGDGISMSMVVDAAAALIPISSGAPERMFAYRLGAAP